MNVRLVAYQAYSLKALTGTDWSQLAEQAHHDMLAARSNESAFMSWPLHHTAAALGGGHIQHQAMTCCTCLAGKFQPERSLIRIYVCAVNYYGEALLEAGAG
mmetsp:Transcript_16908/g.31543  ORF Transcript_16908/g.31543 Transcript_16908/m.31543 type:complete len:102 (-) Transcript_16908:968-1273(-)